MSKSKGQFSLATIVLLLVICSLLFAWWDSNRRMNEAEIECTTAQQAMHAIQKELDNFKIEYGVFEVANPKKIEVQQRPETGSRSWTWDMFLPGGPGYVVRVGHGDILAYGTMANGPGKPKLTGIPNADDFEKKAALSLSGQGKGPGQLYRVSARLEKADPEVVGGKDQYYSFSVSAANIGDDGKKMGTISSAIYLTKEDLKWYLSPSQLASISTGANQKYSADAGESFVLYWVRDNSGPPAQFASPAEGLIVWVEAPPGENAKEKK